MARKTSSKKVKLALNRAITQTNMACMSNDQRLECVIVIAYFRHVRKAAGLKGIMGVAVQETGSQQGCAAGGACGGEGGPPALIRRDHAGCMGDEKRATLKRRDVKASAAAGSVRRARTHRGGIPAWSRTSRWGTTGGRGWATAASSGRG